MRAAGGSAGSEPELSGCRHVGGHRGRHGGARHHRVLPGEAADAAERLRGGGDDPEGGQHHQSRSQVSRRALAGPVQPARTN